uniref:DUF4408 domain-containing protein n=1 Tax=Nelumbo nucifera TaxID=4432 RepID=A0A822XPA5_NELNU|nr:TPA_asm: hypothetical protein HUJ06_024907 [Nelumbo nucifera]
MDKLQRSEIVKVSFIASLLLITPLLSTSMRPPYLYFLVNLLIIALGADAGLLSSFSGPQEDKKPDSVVAATKPTAVSSAVAEASPDYTLNATKTNVLGGNDGVPKCPTEQKPNKVPVVGKSASEKIVTVVKVRMMKKCPSMPSLFFIGGGDEEEEIGEDDEKEEEMGILSAQELFTKAEDFINNFHKQLNIQREESWKNVHGFYQNEAI